jgi:hypothetical protein
MMPNMHPLANPLQKKVPRDIGNVSLMRAALPDPAVPSVPIVAEFPCTVKIVIHYLAMGSLGREQCATTSECVTASDRQVPFYLEVFRVRLLLYCEARRRCASRRSERIWVQQATVQPKSTFVQPNTTMEAGSL